ncbi:MAG: alpha/beta fold hydrolase, partial [Chloroflexi bacterium]|nr:alpha/beta fold hydrolase [Chloroflexota bacterium]
MEDKTISLVNGRFNVGYMEAGSGPDLLFIHGAGGLMWDPFLEQLSQHHRVIAPKLPGTANSTGVEWLMDHHDVFYFYWDFLDALGVDEVVVVGHSMGGWFAAEVAAMQPSRVSKLVLIAPAGLWNDDYPVADFFAMMPNELVPALFHDTNHPGAQMMTAPPPE